MRLHRYSNKRVGKRGANGQFQRITFADVFGESVCDRPQICNGCGHQWQPLVMSGKCPECGNQDKRPVPPPDITAEVQQEIETLREIRRNGFIDPRRVDEAVKLERKLQPWIRAGLVY